MRERDCALFCDVSEEDDLVVSWDGRKDVAEQTAYRMLFRPHPALLRVGA